MFHYYVATMLFPNMSCFYMQISLYCYCHKFQPDMGIVLSCKILQCNTWKTTGNKATSQVHKL